MEYRNAKYIDSATDGSSRVDCEIKHDVYGWIPYTIDPADTDMTVDNSELLAELAGNVAPYVPPVITVEQIRAGTSIDRSAFCNGLADAGVLTDAEAIAAARGEWPASFAGFLDYLTTTQRRDAQITWASCVTVQRNHEFVVSLAWWTNMTDAQVDALFGI